MKGFDVLKVKSAVKNHNKFDLSRSHLTTMEFGQIVPLMVEETVPGDKFNVSAEYFSRLAPLAKPTYGKFAFKTVAGFVPYHQIAIDADAWLGGKTVFEGQNTKHRFVTLGTLHTYLKTYCITTSGATSANSQYSYTNSSGNVVYNVFTNAGRFYVKVLNALGYALPQNVDERTTSTWTTTIKATHLSAYPLLAFFKLYNDYMSQSQRFNVSLLTDLLYKVKYNINYTNYYNSTTGEVQSGGLNLMFSNLLLNFENDYFTSAWQSPNNPLGTTESITSVGEYYAAGVTQNIIQNVSNTTMNPVSSPTISQRALDWLKDFDDWVRRNNYSGSRAVQQVYSRFGIKTDDYKTHYAQVITTDTVPVQVGDVTQTVNNAGAGNASNLGEYAGKGIMNGQNGFSVDCSDYGLLIVLGYYTVVPMMSFGYDRRVLRANPLDYYTPEFDGIGADPISVGEVWESPIAADAVNTTDIYGFTERYNAYRYGRDVITGEFRNYNANNTDWSCWHTGRNLANARNTGNLVAQSSTMNTLAPTDSEFNRIFSETDGKVDHFYLTCKFNVSAVRPMLNLNQVPRLGEGDTAVPRNGNVIS